MTNGSNSKLESGGGSLADFHDLTFVRLIEALRQDKWLYLSAFSICVVGMIVLSFVLTPKYRSTALLAPVDIQDVPNLSTVLGGQLGGLASIAGFGATSGNRQEEALATLRSRDFTSRFIEDERLLPLLFPDKWSVEHQDWLDSDDAPTTQDGFDKFEREIRSVEVDRRSGLITLSIYWSDPEQASVWASKMVQRVNLQIRQQAISEAQESIAFLREELEKTTIVDVRTGIYELMTSNINKIMLANVRDEYAFRVVDPPVAPDVDKYVTPNHLLFALLGIVAGVFLVLMLLYGKHLSAELRYKP